MLPRNVEDVLTYRCQATTKNGTRCCRNAQHYHAGKSLCNKHKEQAVEKKNDPR